MHLMSLICCEFIIIVYTDYAEHVDLISSLLNDSVDNHSQRSDFKTRSHLCTVNKTSHLLNHLWTSLFIVLLFSFELWKVIAWSFWSHSCVKLYQEEIMHTGKPLLMFVSLCEHWLTYTPCLFWLKQHGCNFGGFPALVIVGYSSDIHPVFFPLFLLPHKLGTVSHSIDCFQCAVELTQWCCKNS